MRLFDVDALESYLEKRLTNRPELFGWLCARIADIPTIDAVEVVRCKNCKHYQTSHYFPNEKICKLTNLFHSEDFFCASGERRNDEND